MADFADLASDWTEMLIEKALEDQKEKARIVRSRMPFLKSCFNCSFEIGDHAHFCDSDCRRDWMLREWQHNNKIDSDSMQLEYEDDEEFDGEEF